MFDLCCCSCKFCKNPRLRYWNPAPSAQNSNSACLEQFPCFAALRSPEDLLRPAWPGVAGAVSAPGGKGAGGLCCLSLPRLMMVLPGPGVVMAPPASQLPVLASSVHLETPPPPTIPLTRQLRRRNNSNLGNFPQSVIMPFRIVSFSDFTLGCFTTFCVAVVRMKEINFCVK